MDGLDMPNSFEACYSKGNMYRIDMHSSDMIMIKYI